MYCWAEDFIVMHGACWVLFTEARAMDVEHMDTLLYDMRCFTLRFGVLCTAG
jgi:hypothetical protein